MRELRNLRRRARRGATFATLAAAKAAPLGDLRHVRLTERAVGSGAETQRYTYYNTGLAASFSSGTGTGGGYTEGAHAAYSYDANGRKLTELASVGGAQTENATVTYDALGRMATWAEGGSTSAPVGSVAWEYDAVGNVRRRSETFRYLDASGAAASTAATASYYYAFDAMNRVVTDHGTLVSSAIVRGGGGTDLTYDLAGNRKTAITDRSLTGYANVFIPDDAGPGHNVDEPIDPGNGHYEQQVRTYAGENRESYSYDASGRLSATTIAATNYNDNGNGTISSTGVVDRAMGGGTFSYDALGRQTHQVDTVEGGTSVYDHAQSYDARGRVYYDSVTQLQGSDTVTTYTTSSFGDGTSGYALGAVTGVTTSGFRLAGGYSYVGAPNTSTTTTYGWYDNAVQSQVDYTPNTATPGTVQHSYYTNSASGVLKSASVVDGRSRTITLTNDALGQAIRRDEADGNGALGDPHEVWYRFDGKQIGYTGNDGTYDTSYAGSLNDRTHTIWGGSGAFRYGATGGMANAEFSDRLTPINTWAQGGGGGSYTVRGGDSLSGIAAQLWGDAGLWYKLAEANGITGDSALTAGRTLTVPSGVMRNTDSAATFKPYDVSQAYGDTSPTTPTPAKAKGNKCGTFGMILQSIVTIAVSIALSFTPLAPVAPIIGDAVGQTFGMATGIQQGGFNWKEFGITVITAGLTQGFSMTPTGGGQSLFGSLGISGGGFLNAAARGVLVNATTQGIALTTGLQSKFSFASVAAAGVVAGVSDRVGAVVGYHPNLTGFHPGNALRGLVTGAASAIAGAATRSAITGTDFGDNIKAVLPDVIGSTFGGLIGNSIVEAAGLKKASPVEQAFLKDAQASANAKPAAGSGAEGAPVAGLSNDQQDQGDIVVTAASRSPKSFAPIVPLASSSEFINTKGRAVANVGSRSSAVGRSPAFEPTYTVKLGDVEYFQTPDGQMIAETGTLPLIEFAYGVPAEPKALQKFNAWLGAGKNPDQVSERMADQARSAIIANQPAGQIIPDQLVDIAVGYQLQALANNIDTKVTTAGGTYANIEALQSSLQKRSTSLAGMELTGVSGAPGFYDYSGGSFLDLSAVAANIANTVNSRNARGPESVSSRDPGWFGMGGPLQAYGVRYDAARTLRRAGVDNINSIDFSLAGIGRTVKGAFQLASGSIDWAATPTLGTLDLTRSFIYGRGNNPSDADRYSTDTAITLGTLAFGGELFAGPRIGGLAVAETGASEFLTVFRGDRLGTTIIKSNAAREGGYASSQRIIDSNNLDDLFRSHALDSSSPPSPFISVTSDPAVARYFAGPTGIVNEFRIPVSRAAANPFNNYVVPAGPGGQLIPEAEFLVPNYIRPSEYVRRH